MGFMVRALIASRNTLSLRDRQLRFIVRKKCQTVRLYAIKMQYHYYPIGYEI